MKKQSLFAATFVVASCVAAPAGNGRTDEGSEQISSLTTAEDEGLELMLPFPPTDTRTLTRAYGTDSHTTHGEAYWDDAYALDFAGESCTSWNTPVLAAEDGIAMTLPPNVAQGSADAKAYEQSYGNASAIIDHGNGCYTQYAHLESRSVTDGARVARGQEIGREGNRGHVSGASCAAHPGTHLHFKAWCDNRAIVPEPLSGYHALQAFVGKRFAHRALHHPPGTLVQAIGTSEIYRVEDARTVRHVTDEKVWRSYRFFQDRSREWATVIPVSREELDCHDERPALKAPAKLVATTCNGSTVFVAFEGNGTKWSKRIPFEKSQAGYRILLRSWGFAMSDVVTNNAWACSIPVVRADDRLPLRDGTVIEQASDNDFYVIAGNGTAYRLRRALMRVLYGDGWPMVIQVPDGSVPSLVRSVSTTDREFTLADMTTCPNRRHTLETGLANGVGGAVTEAPPVIPAEAGIQDPAEPSPTPSPPPVIPTPLPVIPAEAGIQNPAEPTPPQITCTRYGTTFTLEVTGAVHTALVGTTITSIARIEVGSDRYGWSNANIGWTWQGEQTYRLAYPVDIGTFNLYALGTNGEIGWFDLPDADQDGRSIAVTGDCRMVCTTNSCAIALK